MKEKVVYIVYCIDAEGPLYESLAATFKRLHSMFNIKMQASRKNLKRLQNMEIDLGDRGKSVALMLDEHMLSYNETWDKIDTMLHEVLDEKFRRKMLDSYSNGLVYNWFCVDHVGFKINLRRRDIGYHCIFDHYRELLNSTKSLVDGVHFHYHPVPFSLSAHHCATSYFAHSDTLFQILGRRIIDRNWFPCAHRPGFNVIRPDSHWFLEQYIPFDFSNESCSEENGQSDQVSGRFGDWRHAPLTWEPYHPDHDDYQKKGNCRRLIIRCLSVDARVRNITQEDVDQAFFEASEGKRPILSFTNHDFRSIKHGIETIRGFLSVASNKYPDIKFKFCEARQAVKLALNMKEKRPCNISLMLEGNHLTIKSDTPIFGPQPFFIVKTIIGKYRYDNLDFQKPFESWSYVFDEQTTSLREIEKVGVAANDNCGNTTVVVMDRTNNNKVETFYH